MLIDARVEIDNGEPKLVQSPGWDLGHHEEFHYGLENKII
jgi:hypothetical protein